MRIVLLITFMALLISCSKTGSEMNLKNKSSNQVDSAFVTNGYDTLRIPQIKPQNDVTGKLNFSSEIKQDGQYEIILYKFKTKSSYRFGYYSNGTPASSKMIIEILNDTILVDEIFK